MLYNKCTNISNYPEVTGSNIMNAGKIYNIKQERPPINWINYNTGASKFAATHVTIISIGSLIHQMGAR